MKKFMPEEDKYYRYEKNTLLRYFLEDSEFFNETLDEAKYGFDYIEVLRKIGSGKINANDLGVKM